MPFIEDRHRGVAAARLVVVLWVGEPAGASTLAAFDAEGIGVIPARDAAHVSELLTHFRAGAVLSASVDHLLSCADRSTPLVLVGPYGGSLPGHIVRVSEPTPQMAASAIGRLVRTRTGQQTTAA